MISGCIVIGEVTNETVHCRRRGQSLRCLRGADAEDERVHQGKRLMFTDESLSQ